LGDAEGLVVEGLLGETAAGSRHRLFIAHYYRAIASAVRGRTAEARAALAAADAVNPGPDGVPVQLEFIAAGLTGDYRWMLDRAGERGLLAGDLSRQGALALAVAGMAATEMGDFAAARRYVSRARSTYGDRTWGFQSEWARYAEALLRWRETGPETAVATLRDVTARLMAMDAWTFAIPPLLDLAEVGGRLGHPEPVAAEGLEAVADR